MQQQQHLRQQQQHLKQQQQHLKQQQQQRTCFGLRDCQEDMMTGETGERFQYKDCLLSQLTGRAETEGLQEETER